MISHTFPLNFAVQITSKPNSTFIRVLNQLTDPSYITFRIPLDCVSLKPFDSLQKPVVSTSYCQCTFSADGQSHARPGHKVQGSLSQFQSVYNWRSPRAIKGQECTEWKESRETRFCKENVSFPTRKCTIWFNN